MMQYYFYYNHICYKKEKNKHSKILIVSSVGYIIFSIDYYTIDIFKLQYTKALIIVLVSHFKF